MKNISKSSRHCSSDGINSGGILTVDPEPVAVEGSFTSNSSSAGASARLFFCCDIYGAMLSSTLFSVYDGEKVLAYQRRFL